MSTQSRQPLVVVIGATGTGKSQLAVDLALRFNGEIINGDAVQMYDGLPIITNKIPEDERRGIPHHLLGCVGLQEPTWRVDRFVKEALRTIQEIRSRGRLPILVGGTHYYTQSLLFNESLLSSETQDAAGEDAKDTSGDDDSKRWPILEASAAEMLEKLKEVDPVMAQRWHPNDVRKIRRSLEVWLQTGRKASDVYAEQEARRAGGITTVNGAKPNPADASTEQEAPPSTQHNSDPDVDSDFSSAQPGLLRFPTLILWPHVPRPILAARLETRVDKMVQAGLLAEARSLHTSSALISAETGTPVDETRGIYAAVGYKEFLPYLNALAAQSTTSTIHSDVDNSSSTDQHTSSNLQALAAEATDLTKGATRRYAKSQLRWIRIKLAHALEQANTAASSTPQANTATMYILDASDPSPPTWSATVLAPAVRYTDAFLASTSTSSSTSDLSTLPDPQTEAATFGPEFATTLQPLRALEDDRDAEPWQVKTCDVCGVSAAREEEWKRHLGSGRHRRAVAGQAKRDAWELRKAGGGARGGEDGERARDGKREGKVNGEVEEGVNCRGLSDKDI